MMTRKRFVKLLMARWDDRNRANKIAYISYKVNKMPYVATLEAIRRWNEEEYWN